VLENKHKKT